MTTTNPEDPRVWNQLARRYHDEVITPFDPGVRFQFKSDLRKKIAELKQQGLADSRIVIDFGCGIGEALALVAGKVGLAIGLDFSKGMLNISRRRLQKQGYHPEMLSGRSSLRALHSRIQQFRSGGDSCGGIVLVEANMLHMISLIESCDVAFAINSLVFPTTGKSRKAFEQVAASVVPGGLLHGVFPSLDTMEYLLSLAERSEAGPDDLGEIDFHRGIYTTPSGEKQTYYSPEMISELADRNGLSIKKLEKIHYPWTLIRKHGWGYFPGRERLWDWYLVASK